MENRRQLLLEEYVCFFSLHKWKSSNVTLAKKYWFSSQINNFALFIFQQAYCG